MVAAPETPEPILESKGPAPVTPPAKRTAAKKAPAKKTAAKKLPAEKAPISTGPVPTGERPTLLHVEPVSSSHGILGGPPWTDRFAMVASITEDMLNDVLLFVVGAGVPLEPVNTSVALPAMGEVGIRLALTVTGATAQLRSEDDGRVRVIVSADGDVSTTSTDYEGDDMEAGIGVPPVSPGGLAMPVPPAPIPVRVEALARPFIELRDDSTLWFGVDVRTAELVSLQTDSSAPVPEGVDPAAWAGILAMFGILFGSLGDGLFASLGEQVGAVDMELDPEIGELLSQLGVATGPASVSVSSGLLSVGLLAADGVRGRALPVPIAGKRVGIGLATSVVDALSHLLILRAVGDMPLPFELEVDLGEQQVSGRLRNARVLPESFPDLRSALRTQVRTRLLRGRLELSVQAAWLELPPVVPSIFNTLSRRLGELVSLAPIRVRFPARIELPVIPDSDDTLPIVVDDLRVTTDGVGVVLSLA